MDVEENGTKEGSIYEVLRSSNADERPQWYNTINCLIIQFTQMGTYLFVHEEKELFRREEPIQSCGQVPFSIRHAINQTVLISVINMYVLFSETTAVA